MPKKNQRPSAYVTAHDIIRVLREDLLRVEEGTFIGSVDELMTRYGISRSTLRQAVRVLEHEELLTAKRGVSGGFYAARPRLKSVVAATATYLHSRQTNLSDFVNVAASLNREMARLAALSTNTAIKQELAAVIATDWQQEFPSAEAMVRADRQLERLLIQLAANCVIEVFLNVTYSIGLRTLRLDIWTGERRQQWRRQRLALVNAILAGDAPKAVRIADRHYALIGPWLDPPDAEMRLAY